MNKLGLLPILALVAGCTTGYQPHTWTGGYKDSPLPNGNFAVEYLGNGTTSPALVMDRWNMRASEICPNGYKVISVEAGAKDVHSAALVGVAVVPISSSHPWVKGEVRCT